MPYTRGEIIEIPSPIDIHSHLREPGGEQKETIATGTRAALYGGYVLVCDMPNNPGIAENPKFYQTLSAERVTEKHIIAKRNAQTDFAVIGGHDFQNPRVDNYAGMVRNIIADKGYFGHTTGNIHEVTIEDEQVWSCYKAADKAAKEAGIRLPHMLHALGEVGYEAARRIMKELEAPAHLCQVSTATEVVYVAKLKKEFPDLITSGATPHHLLMTGRSADYLYGWLGRMVPKLGEEVDQDKVLWAVNKRIIDCIETDHAPHTTEEKLHAEAENPEGVTEVGCVTCFGVSGIEFALPLLCRLVQNRKMDIETLVDALHTQPKRMLGLEDRYTDARTVLSFEPWQITEKNLKGRSSNTPYLGTMAAARVIDVVVGGKSRINQRFTNPQIMTARAI